jgi:hypothetical protein
MTDRILTSTIRILETNATDPWADYHTCQVKFTGQADLHRMERALNGYYRRRNGSDVTIRVQGVEGNILKYTARWSIGD